MLVVSVLPFEYLNKKKMHPGALETIKHHAKVKIVLAILELGMTHHSLSTDFGM